MTEPTQVGDLSTLIPHAQRMCLLETVEHWDENGIRCSTRTHLDPLNPLRSRDQLAALHLCEYGAQAMALHGALLARGDHPGAPARHGYLVAASDLRWSVERLDQCATPLVIKAVSEFRTDNQVAYRFEISASGTALLSGRASVVLNAPFP